MFNKLTLTKEDARAAILGAIIFGALAIAWDACSKTEAQEGLKPPATPTSLTVSTQVPYECYRVSHGILDTQGPVYVYINQTAEAEGE